MMNNLVDNDLKNLFYNCLIEADKSDAEFLDIKFVFRTFNNTEIDPLIIKRCFYNYVMNDLTICLYDPETHQVNYEVNDLAFKIILYNMHYNHFNLIDSQCIKGKRECCGHGEYYKTDRYIFVFYRFKD